jgi:glycosyltransferase involved in cell wall biosynthesis
MVLSSSDSILLILFLVSNLMLLGFLVTLRQAIQQVPHIVSSKPVEQKAIANPYFPKISVVIPAFNEEDNIEECVKSVLLNTQLSTDQLEVWVVDDQSSDRTLEILKNLQLQLADPRFNLLPGLPRPTKQIWTGKNWACYQASEHTSGEFLLFIDADVRLQPNAIAAVVQTALDKQLDFLTCIPAVVCGSLVEWLVQPLIFINLLISFNSQVVKDPNTKTTYALGPFLLFRASAYQAIGGHKAIAEQVAEDVALAYQLKINGFKLQHFVGSNLAMLRMYRTWSALWEGWTKVIYIGAYRSIFLMLLLIVTMLLIYTFPWIGLLIVTYQVLQQPDLIDWVMLGLAGSAIWQQYWLRQQGSQTLGTSTKYWWLQSVSNLYFECHCFWFFKQTGQGNIYHSA